MSIPATKLKERFGDSRKRRPNKLETKPSRLHRTLTLEFCLERFVLLDRCLDGQIVTDVGR